MWGRGGGAEPPKATAHMITKSSVRMFLHSECFYIFTYRPRFSSHCLEALKEATQLMVPP